MINEEQKERHRGCGLKLVATNFSQSQASDLTFIDMVPSNHVCSQQFVCDTYLFPSFL